MTGPEFFQTIGGRHFFEGQLPALIKALQRIATALEKPSKTDSEERKATYVPDVGYSSHDVIGELKASLVIAQLVKESMFFQVTPLPDDRWEFKVKAEEFDRLVRVIFGVDGKKLANTPQSQPYFNHTRGDGPFAPCTICLELMSRSQLLALVKDMRGGRSDLKALLSRATAYIDATPRDINPEERQALIEDLESGVNSLED